MTALFSRAPKTSARSADSQLRRYRLTLVVTVVCVLAALPLQVEGALVGPLLLPIGIAAVFGGPGPGVLSLALATLAAHFWVYDGVDLLRQAAFVAIGLVVVGFGSAMRRARARTVVERATLEASEARLRASDDRYRAFLEQTTEAIWRYELEEPLDVTWPEERQIEHLYKHGHLAECNDATARSRGLKKASELLGARLDSYLPRDPENLEYVRTFIRGGYRCSDTESHEVDHAGVTHFFATSLIGIVEDGALRRVWGSQRDITRRKEVEKALRQGEERFRALVEAAAQVVWYWDPRSGVGNLQPAYAWWEEITGQSAEEQQRDDGHGWLAAVHPDDRDRIREAWDTSRVHGSRYEAEYRVRSRDGTFRNVWTRMIPIRDPNGEVREIVGMSIETTVQRQVENALRTSEARLRRVLESDVIGIAFWNGEQVTDANEVWLRMLGYDRSDIESGHLSYSTLSPPEYHAADERAVADMMAKGSAGPYEMELFRKDGSRVPVMIGSAALGSDSADIVVFTLDLTERRQVEEQLQTAQRLDTVGRLAGGIAHEANNQMSIILGSTYFLLQRSDLAKDVRDDIEQIERAAEHTGAITRQLLAFSRRQVLQPQLLDLNQEVRDLEPVIQRTLGAQIQLVIRLAPDLGLVRADAGQLSQVLLNLVLNARDAMANQGTLTISTDNLTFTAVTAPAVLGEPILPGAYAVLSVNDSGCGMDAETLRRIFEPFFTTKPVGEGTGLGLSTVHGIVRQSNGYIAVESIVGQGTTFRIYLPVSEPQPKPPPTSSAIHRVMQRRATILLVDDQAPVRMPLARALRAEGYTVHEAGSAIDALTTTIEHGIHVDLLITDIVMPDMSGGDLARKLTELQPNLAVLFTSGHADEEMRRRGLLDPDHPFLQKPYSPEVLTARVRQMLERRRWPRQQ